MICFGIGLVDHRTRRKVWNNIGLEVAEKKSRHTVTAAIDLLAPGPDSVTSLWLLKTLRPGKDESVLSVLNPRKSITALLGLPMRENVVPKGDRKIS